MSLVFFFKTLNFWSESKKIIQKNLALNHERYVLFWFFSSGEPLIHNISTAYTDLTYLPRLNDLPSAREVSSLLFRQNFANTTGHETRNALFAFFGEFLMSNSTSGRRDTNVGRYEIYRHHWFESGSCTCNTWVH